MTRIALLVGLWNTVALTVVFWFAVLNDWEVTLRLNDIGEGWVELGLIHLCLVFIVAAFVVDIRREAVR